MINEGRDRMQVKKETIISAEQQFPVDVFMQDNLRRQVIVDLHWHDCVEILFMISGRAEQQINEQSFVLHEGDLLVINQGNVHGTVCYPGEDVKILVIKFLPQILDVSGIKAFESKYITAFLDSYIKLSSDSSEDSKKLVLDIYKEFSNKKIAYEIFIKGCIYQLIAELIRTGHISVYNPDINERQMKDLNKLVGYIEQNFAQPIKLEEAAKILNFSYHYLSRFFKKVTGKILKNILILYEFAKQKS